MGDQPKKDHEKSSSVVDWPQEQLNTIKNDQQKIVRNCCKIGKVCQKILKKLLKSKDLYEINHSLGSLKVNISLH